jgi:GNAT superfamily N-acetyltransferase
VLNKNNTVLTWVDTIKEHCIEFNRWSNEQELQVKTDKTMAGVENLNRFLSANQGGGLGTFLRAYIKKQPDDYFYDPNENADYFVKTALNENGEPVGFMAFHYKFERTTGEEVMHILMFAVNPEMQGKGYGYAMMRDVKFTPELVFGLKQCKVTCSVHYENVNCQKVIGKFGFVRDVEKYLKYKQMGLNAENEDYFTFAGPQDEDLQAILKAEIEKFKTEKGKETPPTNGNGGKSK